MMNNMFRTVVIGLLVSLSFILQAQDKKDNKFFDMGLRTGVHNTETDIIPKNYPDVRSGESQMGYHAGTYMRFNFGVFYFEPEFQFARSYGELEFTDDNGKTIYRNFGFNRLDVPLQVGQKLGPLRLYGGINFNFNRSEGLSSMVANGMRNETRAWRAGLGVDAGNFSMDVRYESSLGNNFEGINHGGELMDINLRFTHIYLSLGYKIL
jgi:hypothetical protein